MLAGNTLKNHLSCRTQGYGLFFSISGSLTFTFCKYNAASQEKLWTACLESNNILPSILYQTHVSRSQKSPQDHIASACMHSALSSISFHYWIKDIQQGTRKQDTTFTSALGPKIFPLHPCNTATQLKAKSNWQAALLTPRNLSTYIQFSNCWKNHLFTAPSAVILMMGLSQHRQSICEEVLTSSYELCHGKEQGRCFKIQC